MSNNVTHRRLSDFIDHSQVDRRSDPSSTPGALAYDYNFEARFRFTPIQDLPSPKPWQPPPVHARSSKQHLNVR